MLGCVFESRLGLEFPGFKNVAFSEVRRRGFSSSTPVSPLVHRLIVEAKKIKLK